MSWLSDLFNPKKKELEPDKTAGQMGVGNQLTSWASKYLDSYVPMKDYPGKFTAPTSTYENQGLGWLQQYLDQPALGENYKLAADEIKKTLSGGYNPYTSPEYDAFKKGASLELQDQLTTMKRGQGARGSFFNNTSKMAESNLRNKSVNYLDQLLATMSDKERQRKLDAVPTAMNLEAYAQGAPLAKATAGTTLGSLPRLIEQADLEAQYKDFLRKQDEGKGVVSAAQSAFATPINYGVKTQETASPFERIMGVAAPLIGSIAGNAMLPGIGGWLGGMLGGAGGTAISSYNPSSFGSSAMNWGG